VLHRQVGAAERAVHAAGGNQFFFHVIDSTIFKEINPKIEFFKIRRLRY
jgi:hypothetical protein